MSCFAGPDLDEFGCGKPPPGRWPEWLSAVVLAWLCTGIIISMSGLLARKLGEKVLLAIERLMGMLLVAIAIQMLMTGIASFISSNR